MNINSTTLFGFPVMDTKIDKKSYDKKSIISTIEKNFKISNQRNSWDKESVLHHSFNDWNNSKYHRVDFDTLVPVYKKTLLTMFNKMNITSTYHFNFIVDNYTCLSNSNFMQSHVHPGADFTAVHYLQFDKKHHTATKFENTLPYVDYIQAIRPQLFEVLSAKHPLNTWAYKDWTAHVEEDSFYFYPAYLKHQITPQTSKKKNRITVVLNITLNKGEIKQ